MAPIAPDAGSPYSWKRNALWIGALAVGLLLMAAYLPWASRFDLRRLATAAMGVVLLAAVLLRVLLVPPLQWLAAERVRHWQLRQQRRRLIATLAAIAKERDERPD